MRLVIVSDAWMPQVNGVVTVLRALVRELSVLGVETTVLHPGCGPTVALPGYAEIRVSGTPWRVGQWLRDARPDAVHIATEGPLGFAARRWQLGAVLLGLVGMLVLGWLDDRHELKPLPKFAGQFLIATLVAAAGVRVTLFVPSVVFSYLVTVLWIVGITNALNFLDNMNGLCAGIGALAAGFFALAAARNGQYLVASLALLGCGSLLGFLPWNYPRASSFLGDAGSHVTGFLLAVLAILPSFYSADRPHALAVLSPLLVLIVPLADLASVVWIRARLGRPPWIGDTNHFSHRLVRAGFTRPKAVALLWAAGAAGGVAALLL